jgi:hypothetical protein
MQLELLRSWAAQEQPGHQLIVLSGFASGPSGVLVPEYALTEDFHVFLTARTQPSDSKRALPSVLLCHEHRQDADRV